MLRCSVEMRQRYSTTKNDKCNRHNDCSRLTSHVPCVCPGVPSRTLTDLKSPVDTLNTKTSTEGDDQIAPRHVLHDRSRTDSQGASN
jgi:hypothetical protein